MLHVYLHNAGSDFEAMQAFSQELGFQFSPVWAQFYPLEKVMAYCSGKQMSEADRETISWLAYEPEAFLAAAQAYRNEPCRLQEEQTAINFDGSVQLCCATYDPALIIASDFLSVTGDELLKIKHVHRACTDCIAGGYHSMMMYHGIDQIESEANKAIGEKGACFKLVGGQVIRSPDSVAR